MPCTRDWSLSSLQSLSSLLLPHRAPRNLFQPCSSLRALLVSRSKALVVAIFVSLSLAFSFQIFRHNPFKYTPSLTLLFLTKSRSNYTFYLISNLIFVRFKHSHGYSLMSSLLLIHSFIFFVFILIFLNS